MFFQKRAFTIQFSWIFILIVGFMVMLFVITSISKQGEVSTSDVNVEILQNVDSIISTSWQSVNTFKIVNTPKITIEYICEDNYSAYSVNSKLRRVDDLIIFAPKQIDGKKIFTWSKEYKMPMKIVNVLYLTNEKHKYIFVNSSTNNVMRFLSSNFPENMTFETVNPGFDLEDGNFDMYTIISTDEDYNGAGVPASIRKKTKVVIINTSSGNYQNGNVSFYSFNNEGLLEFDGEGVYLDESTLYGAIFSSGISDYECTIDKLMRKSKNLYQIYHNVAEKERDASSKAICISAYYPAVIDMLVYLNDSIDARNYEEIVMAGYSLDGSNKNLRKYGCPLIY